MKASHRRRSGPLSPKSAMVYPLSPRGGSTRYEKLLLPLLCESGLGAGGRPRRERNCEACFLMGFARIGWENSGRWHHFFFSAAEQGKHPSPLRVSFSRASSRAPSPLFSSLHYSPHQTQSDIRHRRAPAESRLKKNSPGRTTMRSLAPTRMSATTSPPPRTLSATAAAPPPHLPRALLARRRSPFNSSTR